MILTSFVNQALSILTVLGQVAVIALVILLFLRKHESGLVRFVARHALALAFLVALIATAGSLTYSDVIGYAPCKLCWFQRIFMYPQVILLGIALWKKDRAVINYALGLSIPGAFIAGYHYLLQLGVAPTLSCGAVGYSVSCAQRFVLNFGYITIPLMAFTAFALIIIFSLVQKRASR